MTSPRMKSECRRGKTLLQKRDSPSLGREKGCDDYGSHPSGVRNVNIAVINNASIVDPGDSSHQIKAPLNPKPNGSENSVNLEIQPILGSGSEVRVLPIHSVSPDQDRSVIGEHPKSRPISGDGGEVSIPGKSEIHGSEGEDVQPSHSFSGSETSVLGKSFTGLGESKVAVVEGMTISVVETGVGGGLTTHSHPSQTYELLSRVPKVVSHTEALDYGDVLQVDNSGVAYPGARSSGNVSSTDAGTIFGPVADLHGERGKRSDLQGKSTAGYGYAKDVVGSGAGGGGSQYWAPKKGTNTSLIEHIGARSSKGVSGDSKGTAHASSGVEDDINKTNAKQSVRSAKHGYAPSSSNPAIGAHLKSLLRLGGSLSSGRQDEHVRKGDLQGLALEGNGYVHCTSDFPATFNSEIANDPVRSWKSLVSMPVKTGGPLQFCMPQCVDGMIVAKPPKEAVNEGIDMWKGCLVGQFLDKRLPFAVVRSLVNRLWGKREMPEISTTENGLFFFRFRDPEARDWVMDAGPWHLAGRPFILRAWKPGMDMLNIQLSSIPIWVRFYNIPLEYWTSTCLGHIASTVGIPLHLDPLTENQTKLSFARICIEVGVDCVFPKSVLLDRGNGNYSTIRIEYPWAPKCCSECKLFGHNLGNCQVRKSPSCGITENSKHEATDRQDIENVGEGMKLAVGNSTNSADSDATTPTIFIFFIFIFFLDS